MYPKVILYKSKNYSDGTNPVMIQVVVNSKAIRKVLFKINPKDFDGKKNRVKPSHLFSVKYNELIIKTLQETELKIIESKIKKINITKEYLFNESITSLKFSKAIELYQVKLLAEKNILLLKNMIRSLKRL